MATDGFIFEDVDRVSGLTPDEFRTRFADTDQPVVLQDFAKDWAALEKWTPEYFKEKYGSNQVKVFSGDFGKPGETYMSKADTMAFGTYLDEILTHGKDLRIFLYNIMSNAPELYNDITLPKLLDGISKNFLFTFFGPKGAVTQNHYDIDMTHVFHTAIRGRKKIYLFHPDQSQKLYRHPFTIRSYIDIEQPDFERYPHARGVKGYKIMLEPGETLFMPAGFWHHMIYEDAGYAISLRCPHHKWGKRLEGYYNLTVMQGVDRVANKIAPKAWFDWKEKRADVLAEHA